MNTNTARATEHPEHVWEAQRQRFTQLYKTEKKKLADVQRIMQENHGFYATERQYKRRIKKWKLEKNSRIDEKNHALAALKGSENTFDMTRVYKFNGKDIAAHKLMRHARSHGLGPADIAVESVRRGLYATKTRAQRIFTSLASAANNLLGLQKIFLQDLREITTWRSCSHSWYSLPQLVINKKLLVMQYITQMKSQGDSIGKVDEGFVNVAMSIIAKYFIQDRGHMKTWAETLRVSIHETHRIARELMAELRFQIIMQIQAWESFSKLLEEFQDCFLQPPTKPLRVIEHQNVPQSDQSNIQSEVPDVEMPGMDITDFSSIVPYNSHNLPVYKTADNPEPATNDLHHAEIQLSGHDSMEHLQDIVCEVRENATTDTFDKESNIHMGRVSQDVENHTVFEMENHEIGFRDISTTNILLSPSFPSILIMELPPLMPTIEDVDPKRRSIDLFEYHEGSMPDLEDFLDATLWEDSWELPQLEQDPMLFPGSAEEQSTSRSPVN